MSDRRLLEPFCSLIKRPLHTNLKDRSLQTLDRDYCSKTQYHLMAPRVWQHLQPVLPLAQKFSKGDQSDSGRSMISRLIVGLTVRLDVLAWRPQSCECVGSILSGVTNEGYCLGFVCFRKHSTSNVGYTMRNSISVAPTVGHNTTSERFWR
jgi:hypothetical protein